MGMRGKHLGSVQYMQRYRFKQRILHISLDTEVPNMKKKKKPP
jgi:hypothetical protein